MLARLILLFTIVPFVELTILFRLARWISWGPTIAIVLLTGVLGAGLARQEGLKVLQRIQRDLEAGQAPTVPLVEGALILVAGLLLVTPGVLTDLCGFALLIPPLRRRVRRWLQAWFTKRVTVVHQGGYAASDETDESYPFVDVSATGQDVDPPEDLRLP